MAATAGLRSRLLRASLPYVPQHGFRLAAVRAALAAPAPPAPASAPAPAAPSAVGSRAPPTLTPAESEHLRSSDAVLEQTLFAGDTAGALNDTNPAVAQALLSAWDSETDQQAVQTVLGAGEEDRPGRSEYGQVVAVLEERLRQAGSVRQHLVDALAAECTQPLATGAQFLLPGGAVWAALTRQPMPTPVPLVGRAWRIASASLRGVGWKDESYYTDWYALRLRLATAYGLAELHLASPVEPGAVGSASSFFAPDAGAAPQGPSSGPASSAQRVELAAALLRRVAWARDTSLVADARRVTETAQAVVRWGGRGWLGILRSYGL